MVSPHLRTVGAGAGAVAIPAAVAAIPAAASWLHAEPW